MEVDLIDDILDNLCQLCHSLYYFLVLFFGYQHSIRSSEQMVISRRVVYLSCYLLKLFRIAFDATQFAIPDQRANATMLYILM